MISFLGTNEYLPCIYQKDNFIASESRFIQTALYEMLQHEGTQVDQVYIFLTEEAKNANFYDSISRFSKKRLVGLQNIWKEKFGNEQVELIPVDISSSQLEEDQWELFEKIYEIIDENDELYFDITHSFRSNPVIALIIANFAKTIKNARLKRMFYGNFEALGPAPEVSKIPVEERFAPIVDITSMLELLDWTIGIDSFLRTGNPVLIHQLAEDKGRSLNKHPEYQTIINLSKNLNNLNLNIETVRGLKFQEEVVKSFNSYEEVKKRGANILPQFDKLTNKLEEKLSYFVPEENSVENDFASVLWAYDHGLYQQSITLLVEHTITIIAKKIHLDSNNSNERMAISRYLQQITRYGYKEENDSNENKNNGLNVQQVKKDLAELLETYPVLKHFHAAAELRNDINHGGFREESVLAKNIQKSIRKNINNLRPFFEQIIEEYRKESVEKA